MMKELQDQSRRRKNVGLIPKLLSSSVVEEGGRRTKGGGERVAGRKYVPAV